MKILRLGPFLSVIVEQGTKRARSESLGEDELPAADPWFDHWTGNDRRVFIRFGRVVLTYSPRSARPSVR